MALEPLIAALDLSWAHMDIRAVAFEQLQAPTAADGVGDPRADHRAHQPRDHDPDERQVVVGGALSGVGDGEAGEQHHDLGWDRDACA